MAGRIRFRTGSWAAWTIAGCLTTGISLGADAPAKAADAAKPAEPAKKLPAIDEVVKGSTKIEGLFPLHYNAKEQHLYMEVQESQYDKEFLCPISIARGAGTTFLGGDTLNFGNQWILSFSRVADRILVTRKNVQFKAKGGSPQADAVKVSYTDSVIAAVPIKGEETGGRKVVVDLADLFMTDLADIGVSPDRSRSTWAKVKAFPHNIEVEVSAVFNMSRFGYYFWFGDDSIPDHRGAQVVIHYGLSQVPEDGAYTPRQADDRVGHFLSVVKDYSNDNQKSAFSRYVTRWKLEKSDSSADKSPPKEPIVFWIEKTVPREYRRYVTSGILEWNRAFEKIGFIDAIQVRDQQSGDDFDPEDIRYNTFRWITTSAGFAMGPSRTNPKTGQILDADIVFDESMVRYWKTDYLNTLGSAHSMDLLRAGEHQTWLKFHAGDVPWLADYEPVMTKILRQAEQPQQANAKPKEWRRAHSCRDGCLLGPGMSRQLGLLSTVLAADGKANPTGKIPEEYIGQAIKEVVMHEVGHTLGLRHNFKSSTMLSLQDINNPEITRAKGMTGSVMDYAPANFAPRGQKQGDYFSSTIGPYDYWAIEYAYKPISGDEAAELKKIASRIAEPGLDYGTDEDLYSNPDPRINLFDLGDPLEFAKQRHEFAEGYLKDLADRVVAQGEGWQRARDSLMALLGEMASGTYLAAQYVGSEYSHRDHKGDPNARVPFEPVPLAKQREAIKFLKEKVLTEKAFEFSPDLLKRVAPEHWDHWGMYGVPGSPYPVYNRILSIQQIVLSRFLDSSVLAQIQETEMHVPAGQDVLRLPEVFDALTSSVWSELPAAGAAAPDKSIAISSLRRSLQREHFKRLAKMVVGSKPQTGYYYFFYDDGSRAPADAKSLARLHLKQLNARLETALDPKKAKLDDYTRAHLDDLHDQIQKTLAATVQRND
jgi:hypothetical protein